LPRGSTHRKVGPGVHLGTSTLGEGEVVGISDGTIRKSDGSFLYRLSIVTIALSLTIRPQFAVEYLRRSDQQRGGSV